MNLAKIAISHSVHFLTNNVQLKFTSQTDEKMLYYFIVMIYSFIHSFCNVFIQMYHISTSNKLGAYIKEELL